MFERGRRGFVMQERTVARRERELEIILQLLNRIIALFGRVETLVSLSAIIPRHPDSFSHDL
jgi:hypothetical protein